MLKSAGESHPDAIMYLIDILINIAKEIIPICDDDEKLKIIKTLNDVCKNNQDLKNISFNNTHLNTTDQCETISITYIVTIYGVLKKCFPIVNLHCGFALLYGVGDKINVLNAMPYFYNFQKSSYCNDPQEIEFYQTHCKFTKNNIEDVYEESHEFLDNCILHLEKPNYYSYLKCFEQSKELKNDYGTFNYALCLFENNNLLTSDSSQDGLTIIKELAIKGLDVAQTYYVIQFYKHYQFNKDPESFKQFVYWSAKATSQFNYLLMTNFGLCLLSGNGMEKDETHRLIFLIHAAENDNLSA
ncbi:hypothetical protein QTN25_004322 [Entamoeba marina]